MRSRFSLLVHVPVAAVVLSIAAQQTFAQDTLSAHVPPRDSATTRLNPVVVTPTNVPTPLASQTQAVTVLNGDDLRARGVTTVALALREVPGAMVAQSGSYGSQTSLFLRGGESRYTKVLIDGVPVNTVGGAFSFENLTMDNIDRIEVVRGPASALYGADAVTGVVQIFTRRGAPGVTIVDADGRAGTYGTGEGNLSLRGGIPMGTYSLGGGVHRTSGVIPFNNNYYNGTLSGAFTLTPDDATNIALTTRYTRAVFHFPTDYAGTPTDSNAYGMQHRWVAGVHASRALLPNVTLHVFGENNDVRDLSENPEVGGTSGSPRDSIPATLTNGYRRLGELRTDVTAGPLGTLSLGGQYQKEYEHTTSRLRMYPGTDPSATPVTTESATERGRITRSYYAAVQGSPLARLSYDASVRHDRHEDYGNVTVARGGLRVPLVTGPFATSIRASYGTAFNAPTFDATYGSLYNVPNPDIKGEMAHTLDVAIEQGLWDGRVRATLGAYDQHFSQMIEYVFGSPSRYENLTQVRAKGFEGELHALVLDHLTADLAYTQVIAKVFAAAPGSSASPGDARLRRPSHSGTANVAYTVGHVGSIAATASYVGKRPDMDFSQYPSPIVTLPFYVRLDLSGSLTVLHRDAETVALTARIDNVLDKKYEDVLHFETPRRAVFMGARVTAAR